MQSKPDSSSSEMELVTVLTCRDIGVIALAKSLLQDEGIPFLVKNEVTQGMFGGMPLLGPVEFQVVARDADSARALLQELGPTNRE